jgi:hypothetical protein
MRRASFLSLGAIPGDLQTESRHTFLSPATVNFDAFAELLAGFLLVDAFFIGPPAG